MIGIIIWVIGVVLTVKAALEIWNLKGDTVKKLLFIILIVMTSWLGVIFYYFFGKKEMANWVK